YKREYYRSLARAALQFRGRAFWRFHKKELNALGEDNPLDLRYLALIMGPELLWLASNLGMTAIRALRSLKPRNSRSPRKFERTRDVSGSKSSTLWGTERGSSGGPDG